MLFIAQCHQSGVQRIGHTVEKPFPAKETVQPEARFCFIVRTYWGHGDSTGGELKRLLTSLKNQIHPKYDVYPVAENGGIVGRVHVFFLCRSWEAILIVADSKPFPEMHRIIRQLEDKRIWVFAELVRWFSGAMIGVMLLRSCFETPVLFDQM